VEPSQGVVPLTCLSASFVLTRKRAVDLVGYGDHFVPNAVLGLRFAEGLLEHRQGAVWWFMDVLFEGLYRVIRKRMRDGGMR
jgi:hypothetical protein